MSKTKKQKFAELSTFSNVFQLSYSERNNDFHLKGKWAKEYFHNNNPITLELGCGKGDYTVNLARKFPHQNFIGIDIKGNRLWRGSKMALEENLTNVAFIRTQIDFIEHLFAQDEISEIWLTFPDPYPKKSKEKKRLTSPNFLYKYKNFLTKDAVIHLKTDNIGLYEYTLEVIKKENYHLIKYTYDLYGDLSSKEIRHSSFVPHNADNSYDEILSIKTYYEEMFLAQGKKICYLEFTLGLY